MAQLGITFLRFLFQIQTTCTRPICLIYFHSVFTMGWHLGKYSANCLAGTSRYWHLQLITKQVHSWFKHTNFYHVTTEMWFIYQILKPFFMIGQFLFSWLFLRLETKMSNTACYKAARSWGQLEKVVMSLVMT